MNKPIHHRPNWITLIKNVDTETGETFNSKIRKKYYIIINTIKHVTKSKNYSGGIIEITYECRRKPQLELPFRTTG